MDEGGRRGAFSDGTCEALFVAPINQRGVLDMVK